MVRSTASPQPAQRSAASPASSAAACSAARSASPGAAPAAPGGVSSPSGCSGQPCCARSCASDQTSKPAAATSLTQLACASGWQHASNPVLQAGVSEAAADVGRPAMSGAQARGGPPKTGRPAGSPGRARGRAGRPPRPGPARMWEESIGRRPTAARRRPSCLPPNLLSRS